MRRKLTCPVSAHLEEIETIDDPVTGHIESVTACSAFYPRTEVECARLCARRLNARLRRTGKPTGGD